MKSPVSGKDVLLSGTIKWFDPAKGFGFILPNLGGSDVYLPLDTLKKAGIDAVEAGMSIRYTVANEKGRFFAATVMPIKPVRKGPKSSTNNGSIDPYFDFEREWGLKPA